MALGYRAMGLAAIVAVLAALPAAAPAATPAAASACSALQRMTSPNLAITAATAVAAGPFSPPRADPAAAPLNVPAFCRVQAVARPTADSEIGIEVWLPPAGAWNGKFLGVGASAFQGAINYGALADGLRRGYAVAATDTGHVGDDLTFAAGKPEKAKDWAWRAIHLTAQFGKLVVRNHQGRFPDHAYFTGCDTGGHEALMEAQRFPDDYDGIVAGNPAADRIHEIVGYLGLWRATRGPDGGALLSPAALQRVTAAAVAQCDGLDGVADGVIDDPRVCPFDPASVQCRPGESADCLSGAQVAAVRAVYAGVRNPRTGAMIFPGWPVGSEGFGPGGGQGWGSIVGGDQPRRPEFFRAFLFHDPNWDWRTFDLDRDTAFADEQLGYISAVDPDLRPFARRGGKLIMYTGWADPILSAYDVIDYHQAVVKTFGGPAVADQAVRFFVAPGLAHCRGGPGPDSFDMLSALEGWIEQGRTPERVIASKIVAGRTVRTRPLCAWPRAARWTGKGSRDDAANFVCASPPPRT